jgi:ABC-type amino acid transport substrate-binding protein
VQSGVLSIATEIGNPGWVNGSSATHLTGGVEYEMGLTFAKDFGLKPEFRNVDWTPLISGALSGYDIAMMTIFKTPAREKVNDYSDCYYVDKTGGLVDKGVQVKTLAEARKVSWGYVTGGYAGLVIQKLDPTTTAKSFSSGPDEYEALRAGEITGVMDDLSSIAGRLQSSEFRGTGDHIAAVFRLGGQSYPCAAVQMPKSTSASNMAAVNQAITKMQKSGQITKWIGKYLSPLVNKSYPSIVVG